MSSDTLKIPVNMLVEGMTDESVAKQLLQHVGLVAGSVYGRSGKADLLRRLSRYNQVLAVSPSLLPLYPDREHNPKETLINVARTSQKNSIRHDMVPRQGSGVSVGPRYADRLVEFTVNHWQPDEAAKRSESLQRCIKALSTLQY